jgi:hypothetical protein
MTAPTTLTPAQIAEIYRTAADLLDDRGWSQGYPVGHGGQLCPTAAINVAAGRDVRGTEADLMDPFAAWLVANRADQVREAFRITGYAADDPFLLRWMSGEFANQGEDGARVTQRWNDYRRSHAISMPPSRTKDEVTAALRECADSLTA